VGPLQMLSTHLNENKNLKFICTTHEQGAAMAAEHIQE